MSEQASSSPPSSPTMSVDAVVAQPELAANPNPALRPTPSRRHVRRQPTQVQLGSNRRSVRKLKVCDCEVPVTSPAYEYHVACSACGHVARVPERITDESSPEERALAFAAAIPEFMAKTANLIARFSADHPKEWLDARSDLFGEMKQAYEMIFATQDKVLGDIEKMHNKLERRQSVVEELYQTETSYQADLQLMVNLWQPELTKANLLQPQDVQMMFTGLSQIAFLSQDLTSGLQKQKELPEKEQRIADCFLKQLPFFRLYNEYCANQVKATKIIHKARQNPKFIEFLERLRQNSATRNLDIASFMVKPTQRLTKYPLLLKDLIAHTDSDHEDYQKLKKVLADLTAIVNEVNQKTQERETLLVIYKMQPNMVWKKEVYDLVGSGSLLMRRAKTSCLVHDKKTDTVTKGNCVYLFNHVFMVCLRQGMRWQELCTLTNQGLSFVVNTDEETGTVSDERRSISFSKSMGPVRVEHKECQIECTFYPIDNQDRALWLTQLYEAQQQCMISKIALKLKADGNAMVSSVAADHRKSVIAQIAQKKKPAATGKH
eukprot:TRINITY_DN5788_c0_g1_i2.p1 TRINITY_DN5788_c0_g1~~TRINITY_DN5788_c0_g1_i2.p1  ORF type:complete len:548 (+),score=140.54 TRINITY_DN5788_c0_g1_i2:89-1732(+)